MNGLANEYIPAPEVAGDGKPLPAVADLLKEREFNFTKEPPKLRPIYTLAGVCVSTPGNLASVTAAIKTGKSAIMGGMAASTMATDLSRDCLGFTSENAAGKSLLWFDSEQSPDDFWHCVYRAIRRAGLEQPPAWLHAYCLTGLGHKRAFECFKEALQTSADKHNGVHSVMLDGVADLVKDVNDPGESNDFVAELHNIAIKNDCPIIGVIHFNPGSDKSRGHLGSQLERKAETNLALEKNADEVTVIYSTKNRRAGIPKNSGPCFRFDVERGMHVLTQSRQVAKDEADREELSCLAREAFGKHRTQTYTDLVFTVKKALRVSDKTAERKVARMKQLTVIHKDMLGHYSLCTPA